MKEFTCIQKRKNPQKGAKLQERASAKRNKIKRIITKEPRNKIPKRNKEYIKRPNIVIRTLTLSTDSIVFPHEMI